MNLGACLIEAGAELEVRDLRERVHAGVGASGAVEFKWRAAPRDGLLSSPCTVRVFFWICQPL